MLLTEGLYGSAFSHDFQKSGLRHCAIGEKSRSGKDGPLIPATLYARGNDTPSRSPSPSMSARDFSNVSRAMVTPLAASGRAFPGSSRNVFAPLKSDCGAEMPTGR